MGHRGKKRGGDERIKMMVVRVWSRICEASERYYLSLVDFNNGKEGGERN